MVVKNPEWDDESGLDAAVSALEKQKNQDTVEIPSVD